MRLVKSKRVEPTIVSTAHKKEPWPGGASQGSCHAQGLHPPFAPKQCDRNYLVPKPLKEAWRSIPSAVMSRYSTFAVSLGSIQNALTRGTLFSFAFGVCSDVS